MRTCRPSRAAECAASARAQQQRPPLFGPYPMATFASWRPHHVLASEHSRPGHGMIKNKREELAFYRACNA